MEKLEELLNKFQRLKRLDKKFKIFGSDSHRYQFNDSLSDEDLAIYESKYDVKLPEDYRTFLRVIGNGGAGPYYGINKLEESIPDYRKEDINFLKEAFPQKEDWNYSSKVFEILDLLRGQGFGNLHNYYHKKFMETSEYEVDKEEWEVIKLFSGRMDSDIADFFEKAYWECYYSRNIDTGSLDICEYGCALRYKLIVTGNERGNIWFDARVDQGGLSPQKNKHGKKLSFTNWYLQWLDKSIESLNE